VTPAPAPRRRVLPAALPVFVALPLFLFLTTRFVGNYFLVDDPLLLRQQCERPEPFRHVWTSAYFAPDLYRPLTAATLCFDHARAHLDPSPYYVTNALLMAAASAAVGLLARALLGPGPPAWTAAALYLLFPTCIRTTSWIYGRGEHLFVLLSCLALALWVRFLDGGRRRLLLLFSLLLFAALLSKEVALFTIPSAAFLLARRRRMLGDARSLVHPLGALVIPAGLYFLIRQGLGIPARFPGAVSLRAFGQELLTLLTELPVQSLRGQGSLVLTLRWPTAGAVASRTYDFLPALLAGLVLLGATAALAIRAQGRGDGAAPPDARRREALAFAAVWILSLSYPVLVGDLHEHYTMAPAAGWVLILTTALCRIGKPARLALTIGFLLHEAFLSSWRLDMSRAKSATELHLTRRIAAPLRAPERSVVVLANFHPRGNPFLSLYSPIDSLFLAVGHPLPRVFTVEGWPLSPGAPERTALVRAVEGAIRGDGPWDFVIHRFDEAALDVSTERFDARRPLPDDPLVIGPP
jgi:hypothetical protein